jgi:hypothetical protein
VHALLYISGVGTKRDALILVIFVDTNNGTCIFNIAFVERVKINGKQLVERMKINNRKKNFWTCHNLFSLALAYASSR